MIEPAPAATLSTLHLLGSFATPYTGAECELIEMQRLLAGRRSVQLWSDVAPHRCYAGLNITAVQPFAGKFPKDGRLLIAGVHVQLGLWLKYARFQQVTVFCNLVSHARLFDLVASLREATRQDPELVFVSRMLQLSTGLPGRVSRSMMDVQPFLAVAAQRSTMDVQRPFTVGRVSRDALDKHHPDDPALYRMLASCGVRVRIMGGTCLSPVLQAVAGIELLPAGAEPTTDFYGSLDAFFYRTGASTEAYGRVVVEAMASGLPVVAHVRGGYAEVVDTGISGYLVRTQEEAYDTLMSLRDAPALRREIGDLATSRATALHGAQALARDLACYLR